MTGCRAEFIRRRWWKKQPVRMNSHLRSRQRLALNPHLVPSPAATLTPPPLPYSLTPATLPRERGDLCGFAEPSARGEVRAASPIDRLEGSILTEMLIKHFHKAQAGVPKPPPPGVCTTNTSPGCISTWNVAPYSSRLPSDRSTQLRPAAPGKPPSTPKGGTRRRLASIAAV